MDSNGHKDEPVIFKKETEENLNLIEKVIDDDLAALNLVTDSLCATKKEEAECPSKKLNISLYRIEIFKSEDGNWEELDSSHHSSIPTITNSKPDDIVTPTSSQNSNIPLHEITPSTRSRKRKLIAEDSEKIDCESAHKRVHFDDIIETTHIFKKSVRPKISLPGGKSPSAGILKNKTHEVVKSSHRKSRSHNKKCNNESQRRLNSEDEADTRTNIVTEETATNTGKERVDSNCVDIKSEIIEVSPDNTLDDVSSLSDKDERPQPTSKRVRRMTPAERYAKKRARQLELYPRTNSFHRQKRKSMKNYDLQCPIQEYLCPCKVWFKAGSTVQEHLSVCSSLQPRVLLTKLNL